jgi:hypothetical protein
MVTSFTAAMIQPCKKEAHLRWTFKGANACFSQQLTHPLRVSQRGHVYGRLRPLGRRIPLPEDRYEYGWEALSAKSSAGRHQFRRIDANRVKQFIDNRASRDRLAARCRYFGLFQLTFCRTRTNPGAVAEPPRAAIARPLGSRLHTIYDTSSGIAKSGRL